MRDRRVELWISLHQEKGEERSAKTAKSLQTDWLVNNESNRTAWWAQGGSVPILEDKS